MKFFELQSVDSNLNGNFKTQMDIINWSSSPRFQLRFPTKTMIRHLNYILGSLLLGNSAWAQQEHAVFINAGQEKVQCFPDDMTSDLIGESSLKVMTGLF